MSERVAWVSGTPAPQGSKTHVGGGRMIESSKAVRPWRDAVAAAWTAKHGRVARAEFLGPVSVVIRFYISRPAGHFRPAGALRPSARPYPSVRPDLDKYIRATLDALGAAGAYLDDGQVVELCTSKSYADGGGPPGAFISVTPLESP